MDFLTEELLSRGVSVIFDANSTRREFRHKFMQIAKRKSARYTLLWFQTPSSIALKRLAKRRTLKSQKAQKYYRPIKDKILFRIRNEEEIPRNEPFMTIDGRLPFSKQIRTCQGWLRQT